MVLGVSALCNIFCYWTHHATNKDSWNVPWMGRIILLW